VLYGIPITGVLVGLTALLVDAFALIPYQFPNSYYLWIGLVFLAFVVGAIGWLRVGNWHRIISVLAVVLSALMAFTLVNSHYQYYPTVGALFGVDAQDQVSVKQLEQVRERAREDHNGVLPVSGFTIEVPIPGKVSGFKARNAFIWLPPIWVTNEKAKLPIIIMLSGIPGGPDGWTRAAFADVTARNFAAAHNGVAPILVMADNNGSGGADTECVDSTLGKAETYLTVDVPRYMRTHFNAKTKDSSMGIAGLSEGGMCALMLSLRHPDLFRVFGDYSGLTGPTVGESVEPVQTTQQLFAGSAEAYAAHDPLSILKKDRLPNSAGWFEVGTDDSAPLAAQRTLVPLARSAGIYTCADEVPGGGHDYDLWTQAFKDSLPFMSYRLGLTPEPTSEPATCH
jgi:S-formylglutathione hydrolase FrmB